MVKVIIFKPQIKPYIVTPKLENDNPALCMVCVTVVLFGTAAGVVTVKNNQWLFGTVFRLTHY